MEAGGGFANCHRSQYGQIIAICYSEGRSHGQAVTPTMNDPNSLPISPEISIPRTELRYRASRSGGPGGQHVNTSSTRIELLWDLSGSRAVTDEQRARLRTK